MKEEKENSEAIPGTCFVTKVFNILTVLSIFLGIYAAFHFGLGDKDKIIPGIFWPCLIGTIATSAFLCGFGIIVQAAYLYVTAREQEAEADTDDTHSDKNVAAAD